MNKRSWIKNPTQRARTQTTKTARKPEKGTKGLETQAWSWRGHPYGLEHLIKALDIDWRKYQQISKKGNFTNENSQVTNPWLTL